MNHEGLALREPGNPRNYHHIVWTSNELRSHSMTIHMTRYAVKGGDFTAYWREKMKSFVWKRLMYLCDAPELFNFDD